MAGTAKGSRLAAMKNKARNMARIFLRPDWSGWVAKRQDRWLRG